MEIAANMATDPDLVCDSTRYASWEAQYVARPPEISNIPSVLNEHSSEASQATSAAISVGCPKRPIGMRDRIYSMCSGVICWKRSVSTAAGVRQLTRMP
jgi:hypothetical protein